MFEFVVNLLKQLAPYLAVIAVVGVGYYVYKNYFAKSPQSSLQNLQQTSLESSPPPPPPPPPSLKYIKMLIDGIQVTDHCPECTNQLSYDQLQNIVCDPCKTMYGKAN